MGIVSQHVFLRHRQLVVSQHPTPRRRRCDFLQGKCGVGLEGVSGREGGREGEGQTAFQAESSSLMSEVKVIDGCLELSSRLSLYWV